LLAYPGDAAAAEVRAVLQLFKGQCAHREPDA